MRANTGNSGRFLKRVTRVHAAIPTRRALRQNARVEYYCKPTKSGRLCRVLPGPHLATACKGSDPWFAVEESDPLITPGEIGF